MVIAYVALGSAIGGSVRYLIGTLMPVRADVGFPWATLFVNVTGSLLLGLIARYASVPGTMSLELRMFLTVGICGGYTTFSAFSLETTTLIQRGRYDVAIAYVVISVLLSLAAAFAGMALAQQFPGSRA